MEKGRAGTEQKKSYETPRLTVHGDVDKITEAVGNLGDDGPLGSRTGG